jgi:hypothetical protein
MKYVVVFEYQVASRHSQRGLRKFIAYAAAVTVIA